MNSAQKLISLIVALTPFFAAHIYWAIVSDKPASPNLFEQYKYIVQPLSTLMQENLQLNKALIFIDSLFIDLLVLYQIIRFGSSGKRCVVFGMLLFYSFRTFSLSFCGQWPQPKQYLFVNPGVPSYFVPYDETNDFYFSGHTGLLVGMLVDALCHRNHRTASVIGAGAAYTMLILFATGGHFLNDILIGAVVSIICMKTAVDYKFSIVYGFMRTYCFLAALPSKIWRTSLYIDKRLTRLYLKSLQQAKKLKSN